MIIDFEWEEAPGVRDKVLAATWARLSLKVGDRYVTESVDQRSGSQRSGVYGSLFPLANWLVENWWHLLHEPMPCSPLLSGRQATPFLRDWMQRHNLLAAREGGALPDLTLVRDGDEIVMQWESDPDLGAPSRLRFIGQGYERVSPKVFEDSMAAFVEAVLQRLDERLPANDELEGLAEVWSVIRSSDAEEQAMCQALAMMGLEPYEPEDATEAMLSLVAEAQGLPGSLALDLFSGTDAQRLGRDLSWVKGRMKDVTRVGRTPSWRTIDVSRTAKAHDFGYQTAQLLRTDLGAIDTAIADDLSAVLVDRLGWVPSPVEDTNNETSLEGFVGLDASSSAPRLFTPSQRSEAAERFRMARAIFFPLTRDLGTEGRLLTTAATYPQRAARAFAAEFLAPSDVLAKRVSGRVSEQQIEDLATELKVAPALISHQITNHGLGYVGGY